MSNNKLDFSRSASLMAAEAAVRTLSERGFTYHEGAQQWRPPIGPRNFWIYQGDGNDHLESLTCDVLIHPARLHAVIDNCNKFHMALQRIGSTLELLAGTDITKAAVSAIEALKAAKKAPKRVNGWCEGCTGETCFGCGAPSEYQKTAPARRGYPFADVGGEQC